MAFPESPELMREIYQYRGEYVLLRDDVIVAHAPRLATALERIPVSERNGLKVRRVPSSPDLVTATLSAY